MAYSDDYTPSPEEIQEAVNLGGQYWLDTLDKGLELGMDRINIGLVTSIISYLNKHKKLSTKQARILLILRRAVQYRIDQQQ